MNSRLQHRQGSASLVSISYFRSLVSIASQRRRNNQALAGSNIENRPGPMASIEIAQEGQKSWRFRDRSPDGAQRQPGRPNPDFAALNPATTLRQRRPHSIDFVWNSKISSFRQNPHLTALIVLLYRLPVGHGLTCPGRRREGENRGGSWTLARMEKSPTSVADIRGPAPKDHCSASRLAVPGR